MPQYCTGNLFTASAIICHTASLYHMYKSNYEGTLDERIHACLDAGCDGVEISNGPQGILTWQPHKATIERLKSKTVTIHAELNNIHGISWAKLLAKLKELPWQIQNVTFHPDELSAEDLVGLVNPFVPVSIENMDRTRKDWRTVNEISAFMPRGTKLTYDTAHSMEHGLPVDHFASLFAPAETHLSVSAETCTHDLTHRYNDFPHVPSGCPIVTLEGVVHSVSELADEVSYVRERLIYAA